MTDQPRIGFIGLGLMGSAFTARLVEGGYGVTGYDIDPVKIETAEAHGVVPATSPAALTEACDLIMLCVTSTDAVRAAVLGENGVADGGTAQKVLIDFSTTVVADTRDMAASLGAASGMGWVDAPVSGGPPAARAGTLAIMLGGAERDIARASGVIDHLAATATHFGAVGAGQTAKMVNQVLVLNNYVVLAEALALAEAGGIDAAKIPEALAAGHAGSNLLAVNFPLMIERDYRPRGYARQVLKDLGMVRALAADLGVPTPMSSQAAELYRIHTAQGHGEKDGVSIFELLKGAAKGDP